MVSFNEFGQIYNLKNKATPNIKIQRNISCLFFSDVGFYLKDDCFPNDVGIVNLHPFGGSDWISYFHESYFDSHGCLPPQKLFRFILKRNGHCLYCEYKIQALTSRRDSYFAAYCSYRIYLANVIGRYFNSAALNLYKKRLSLHK